MDLRIRAYKMSNTSQFVEPNPVLNEEAERLSKAFNDNVKGNMVASRHSWNAGNTEVSIRICHTTRNMIDPSKTIAFINVDYVERGEQHFMYTIKWCNEHFASASFLMNFINDLTPKMSSILFTPFIG